jgi:hypothetical protein
MLAQGLPTEDTKYQKPLSEATESARRGKQVKLAPHPALSNEDNRSPKQLN